MLRPTSGQLVLCTALAAAGTVLPVVPASADPPSNDDRSGAVEVVFGVDPWEDVRDTSEATAAPDDPSCSGGATVWYAFTGTGREVVIDTAASTYGTTLAVLGPDGDELLCTTTGHQNSPQAAGELVTEAGAVYLVAVGSSFGPGDLLGVSFRDVQPYDPGDGGGGGEEPPPPPPPGPPPVNDDLAAALPVPGLPHTSAPIDTTGATSEGNEAPFCGSPHHSVWFTYTPQHDQHVAVDTLGSDYDTALAVLVRSPGDWGQVACSLDALGTTQSRVEVAMTAGTTYTLMVSAQFRFDRAVPGTLVLHLEEVVPLGVTGATASALRQHRSGVYELDVVLDCTRPADAGVSVEVVQVTGDRVRIGHGSAYVPECVDGATVRVTVFPPREGPFRAGAAEARLHLEARSLEQRAVHDSRHDVVVRRTG